MRLPQDRILHIDTELKNGKMNIVAEWQGELVRCKDCIYYETCNLRSSHWWKGGYTVDIEFCSFGERKEE